MAATDKEQLETLLSQVNSDDQRVQEFLSNLAKESGLTYGEQEQGDAEPQIDKAEELQKKWGVQTGDLYSIGSHKLLCGDSTKRDDVERVMDGEKARICLTDPPYGLGEKKESGKNDYDQHKDTKENLIELAKLWLPIANNISDVIVFSPGVTNAWLYPEADWIMCWFYGGGQLRSSWGFNCWQPFLCYGNDPSLASGNGGRPDAINMNTPANAKDIDHPCPKPLKLWEWFIERLSFSTDDIFYEPFCGSGTTMVACQNLSRKCRAIEISPKYCAVILQRMTDAFPGIIIEKIDSV
jgi:DNA modification methylase